MAERTKAPVSKTGMGATSSWVRIPLSPPFVGTPPRTLDPGIFYLDDLCHFLWQHLEFK